MASSWEEPIDGPRPNVSPRESTSSSPLRAVSWIISKTPKDSSTATSSPSSWTKPTASSNRVSKTTSAPSSKPSPNNVRPCSSRPRKPKKSKTWPARPSIPNRPCTSKSPTKPPSPPPRVSNRDTSPFPPIDVSSSSSPFSRKIKTKKSWSSSPPATRSNSTPNSSITSTSPSWTYTDVKSNRSGPPPFSNFANPPPEPSSARTWRPGGWTSPRSIGSYSSIHRTIPRNTSIVWDGRREDKAGKDGRCCS
mmetsp:Transcript_19346/g.40477  ORF Transcript_19346/g.40477 Transcript_19346/m.40477 type:complete len:250 (+) Transcript_19346:620-1369(+)